MLRIFGLIAAPVVVAIISVAVLLLLFSQQQDYENADARLRGQLIANDAMVRAATGMAADLYNRNPEAYQRHKKKLIEAQSKLPAERRVDKFLTTADKFRFPDSSGALALDLSDVQQGYAAQHAKLEEELKQNNRLLTDGNQLLMECIAAAIVAFGGTLAVAVIGAQRKVAGRIKRFRSHVIETEPAEIAPQAPPVAPGDLAAREMHIQQLSEAVKAFSTPPPEQSP